MKQELEFKEKYSEQLSLHVLILNLIKRGCLYNHREINSSYIYSFLLRISTVNMYDDKR